MTFYWQRPLCLILIGMIVKYFLLSKCVKFFYTHRGIEAVALDYIRRDNFGPIISKGIHWVLIAISFTTLGGLYYFIYNDIGIANAIQNIWSIKHVETENTLM